MAVPIDQLRLLELPVQDPAFAADPLPWVRRAREVHPWLAASPVGYWVTEYRAIRDLYFLEDRLQFPGDALIDFMGARGSPWGRFNEELLINRQGADHARIRAAVAQAFSPGAIQRLRPMIRATIREWLDAWVPRGAFDFAECAAHFPIRVMCKIIGASPEVIPALREHLEVQGLSYSMDRSLLPAADRAIAALEAFVVDLLAERARGPRRDDLLSDLLAAEAQGALSRAELQNLLVFLFAAGYDTSKNMLTLILYLMLDRPALWERCAEDRPYCSRVTEEALRYLSVSNVPRTAVAEVVYRDVSIPAGTSLQFMLTLSGRDPDAFDEPDLFDPERERAERHLAFGRGSHVCLGQFLARAQIEEAIHLAAQRIRRPRRAGPIRWRPFVGVWGIRSLPIAFEAAQAA
ncbi:MAG: cytochrome P450 hydroxylase [Porticoccaceae bacterium]|nr:MAG: cytochrome P450 hydroxylase [Porticoccaceae bacterium]